MGKRFTQLILVEFKNCAPFVYTVESDKEINIEDVADYFTKTEGFNEERDGITFVDNIITIDIDEGE